MWFMIHANQFFFTSSDVTLFFCKISEPNDEVSSNNAIQKMFRTDVVVMQIFGDPLGSNQSVLGPRR